MKQNLKIRKIQRKVAYRGYSDTDRDSDTMNNILFLRTNSFYRVLICLLSLDNRSTFVCTCASKC